MKPKRDKDFTKGWTIQFLPTINVVGDLGRLERYLKKQRKIKKGAKAKP